MPVSNAVEMPTSNAADMSVSNAASFESSTPELLLSGLESDASSISVDDAEIPRETILETPTSQTVVNSKSEITPSISISFNGVTTSKTAEKCESHEDANLSISEAVPMSTSDSEQTSASGTVEIHVPSEAVCIVCENQAEGKTGIMIRRSPILSLKELLRRTEADPSETGKRIVRALSEEGVLTYHKYCWVQYRQSVVEYERRQRLSSRVSTRWTVQDPEPGTSTADADKSVQSSNPEKAVALRPSLQKYHQCPHCVKVVSSVQRLISHCFGRHDDSRPFKCPCGKDFVSFFTFKSHEKVCTVKNAVKKPVKVRRSMNRYSGTIRLSRLDKGPGFCVHCLQNVKNLQNHCSSRCLKIFKWECDSCNQRFRTSEALCRHQDNRRQLFYCHEPGCDRRFEKETSMKRHWRTTHDKKVCGDCGLHILNRMWIQHGRMHEQSRRFKEDYANGKYVPNPKEPFLCMECGKTYKRLAALNAHKTKCNVCQFQCPMCSGWYRTKPQLETHELTCAKARKKRPYQCLVCLERFHDFKRLTKHMLIVHPNTKEASLFRKGSNHKKTDERRPTETLKNTKTQKSELQHTAQELFLPSPIREPIPISDDSTNGGQRYLVVRLERLSEVRVREMAGKRESAQQQPVDPASKKRKVDRVVRRQNRNHKSKNENRLNAGIECVPCMSGFSSHDELVAHTRDVHERPCRGRYMCFRACGRYFRTFQLSETHDCKAKTDESSKTDIEQEGEEEKDNEEEVQTVNSLDEEEALRALWLQQNKSSKNGSKSKISYHCGKCPAVYPSNIALERHISTNHNSIIPVYNWFKCLVCQQLFKYKKKALVHNKCCQRKGSGVNDHSALPHSETPTSEDEDTLKEVSITEEPTQVADDEVPSTVEDVVRAKSVSKPVPARATKLAPGHRTKTPLDFMSESHDCKAKTDKDESFTSKTNIEQEGEEEKAHPSANISSQHSREAPTDSSTDMEATSINELEHAACEVTITEFSTEDDDDAIPSTVEDVVRAKSVSEDHSYAALPDSLKETAQPSANRSFQHGTENSPEPVTAHHTTQALGPCEKIFLDFRTLSAQNPDSVFPVCLDCRKIFNDFKGVDGHLCTACVGTDSVYCESCRTVFKNKTQRTRHACERPAMFPAPEISKADISVVCDVCWSPKNDETALCSCGTTRHRYVYQSSSDLELPTCFFPPTSTPLLKCPPCPKDISSSSALVEHDQQHHHPDVMAEDQLDIVSFAKLANGKLLPVLSTLPSAISQYGTANVTATASMAQNNMSVTSATCCPSNLPTSNIISLEDKTIDVLQSSLQGPMVPYLPIQTNTTVAGAVAIDTTGSPTTSSVKQVFMLCATIDSTTHPTHEGNVVTAAPLSDVNVSTVRPTAVPNCSLLSEMVHAPNQQYATGTDDAAAVGAGVTNTTSANAIVNFSLKTPWTLNNADTSFVSDSATYVTTPDPSDLSWTVKVEPTNDCEYQTETRNNVSDKKAEFVIKEEIPDPSLLDDGIVVYNNTQ